MESGWCEVCPLPSVQRQLVRDARETGKADTIEHAALTIVERGQLPLPQRLGRRARLGRHRDVDRGADQVGLGRPNADAAGSAVDRGVEPEELKW